MREHTDVTTLSRSTNHESAHPDVPVGRRSDCRGGCAGPSQSTDSYEQRTAQLAATENRGIVWVAVSFILCPCHLPVTLWIGASLLAGTAAGAALRSHPVVAAVVITLLWLGGTWRGLYLLRIARRQAEAPTR
jgi:hypothetical protein